MSKHILHKHKKYKQYISKTLKETSKQLKIGDKKVEKGVTQVYRDVKNVASQSVGIFKSSNSLLILGVVIVGIIFIERR